RCSCSRQERRTSSASPAKRPVATTTTSPARVEHVLNMGTSTIARDLATLLELPGVGPSRARKLLPGRDGGDWLESESLHSALKPNQRDELPRARARVDAAWLQMEAAGVRAISICDPEYPAPMRDLLGTAAPVVLYCLGALALLGAPSVGFCGSRKASEKGMAAAADAAGLLAA